MYPPERRARGISYVLFGAVFGAALGPLVFRPLFAGKELDAGRRSCCRGSPPPGSWLVGLALVLCIRPDPRTIAEAAPDRRRASSQFDAAAPLREILRRPGVLTAARRRGRELRRDGLRDEPDRLRRRIDHGHHQGDVFTVISAHIVGMYALVLVSGRSSTGSADAPCHGAGLLLMALSTLGLAWFESVLGMSASLFGLGLGWNISYVAATTQLGRSRAAVRAWEAGRLHTTCSRAFTGAALALLGGVVYSRARSRRRSPSACATALAAACPRPGSCYNPPPADADVRPLSVTNEDLHRQSRARSQRELVRRRRRGPDPRPARDADRRHAPRQGQAGSTRRTSTRATSSSSSTRRRSR